MCQKQLAYFAIDYIDIRTTYDGPTTQSDAFFHAIGKTIFGSIRSLRYIYIGYEPHSIIAAIRTFECQSSDLFAFKRGDNMRYGSLDDVVFDWREQHVRPIGSYGALVHNCDRDMATRT